jgi:DNA-binding Lrp family transcriptional regulator
MISKKDAEIISHLRKNAREKITTISKHTDIPATTIYDKVRVHEKKIVKKHVTLLDFPKLGLNATAHIAITTERNTKDALQRYLLEHPNVNSLYKANFGSDFIAEVVFKNFSEVESFVEGLEDNYKTNRVQIFNIVDELKKEDFMTKPEHVEVLNRL